MSEYCKNCAALAERVTELEAKLQRVRHFAAMHCPEDQREIILEFIDQDLTASETACEHVFSRIGINNAKHPNDPPEMAYTPHKCTKCGMYESEAKTAVKQAPIPRPDPCFHPMDARGGVDRDYCLLCGATVPNRSVKP